MGLERVCYDCGASTREPRARCDCGEPLWLRTDPVGFHWNRATDAPGIWRYAPLFPGDWNRPTGVTAAAGDTPLVRTPELDTFAGARVHVKDEGRNPTGSFKDRGSALGVARAVATDAPAVGTVSHGNMAMSMAAYAASTALDCLVLVPADISAERLANIGQYDPTILRVAGDYGQLYRDTLALGPEHGIRFVNSDTPLRVEGQKTTALEICESFAPDVPDAVVMPVSSGGHASGVWKALRELRQAGTIDQVPRLYLIQAEACAPIAAAFQAGAETVEATTAGQTIAYSIANPDPPSGNRALRAARDTDGAVVAVPDDEIREAKRRFAADAGLSVESASATTLAGTRKLAAEGEIPADENVVLVATGSGFKEGVPGAAPDPETIALDDVGERLAALGKRT